MKQPTIMYEGEKYALEAINWHSNGKLAHVCFSDNNNKFHVAHSMNSWESEGYDERGNLHLDLDKALAHNKEDSK